MIRIVFEWYGRQLFVTWQTSASADAICAMRIEVADYHNLDAEYITVRLYWECVR